MPDLASPFPQDPKWIHAGSVLLRSTDFGEKIPPLGENSPPCYVPIENKGGIFSPKSVDILVTQDPWVAQVQLSRDSPSQAALDESMA